MTAMTIQSMNELFHHALQDIYYAENQIAKTLSDMMDQATDAALVDNFEHHLEDTQEQIKRLDRVFRALGQTPKGVTCQAILGLIEESQETLREIEDEKVRDAAVLASWASPCGVALPPFAWIMPQGEPAGGAGRSWRARTSAA